MRMNWSGANMRCIECNKYLPDRCTCKGISIEERREVLAMSHNECYVELQDKWIPEEELNSVDFEAKYSRVSLDDIRNEIIQRRSTR